MIFKKTNVETTLVVQRLRICLAMKVTQVQSLVWELRFPHATEQLSLCATTKDPERCNEDAMCHQELMQPSK